LLQRYPHIEEVNILKSNIITNIEKKLTITDYHISATFLTPAVKNLTMLSESEIDKTLQNIANIIQNIKLNNLTQSNESPAKMLKLDECLTMFAEINAEPNSESSFAEVVRYYNFQFNFEDFQMDPILFWHNYKDRFPRLYQLFLQVFSVPATNLSSERNFNYTGLVLSDRRSRLDPEKVDRILFMRSNTDLI
jgi:hypothetical protein